MKKTILAAVAGAAVAGAIGFAAPAAQAAPCSYFNGVVDNGICGTPDIADSLQKAGENLKTNFSPGVAAGNLQNNLDPGTAAGNLEHNLTHGVGSDDQNAP